MKQTCSIHTVNMNHESITVVRHTSLLKVGRRYSSCPEAPWHSTHSTEQERREPRAHSPTPSRGAGQPSTTPQTVVLTGRKKLNQILLANFKAESWQQLCYQNKRDRGRPTPDSLQQQLMRQCQASTQGLSRVQSEIGAGGRGRAGKYLLLFKHFPALNSPNALC